MNIIVKEGNAIEKSRSDDMPEMYARLILVGKRSLAEVNTSAKEQTRQILIAMGREDLTTD